MRPFRRRFRRHFLLGLLACAVLFCVVRVAPWRRLGVGSATSQPRGVEAAKRAEASLLYASLFLRHARGTSLQAAPPEEGQGTRGAGWKLREPASTRAAEAAETNDFPGDFAAANCTMGRCFNAGRCGGDFRVYVYPDNDGVKVSGLYRKILRILRNSPYYTSDPDEACVLVPSWDTLDRDKLSDEYVMKLPSTWLLSHWNGGRNHLFFNLYSGSWPTYFESLDFDPGLAIVAKASFNTASFRQNFDISLPLLHNSHSERGVFPSVMTTRGNLLPIKRRYHLAFKGKRYLYGLGVEPRRSLYHIRNSRDVVMVMTCRHNKNWEKYKDSRCDVDNAEYNRFDYMELLTNSSFCLVPRGRRLGSFRFIESLQSSCIPVSLSNGYILPLDEVIDWHRYSIVVDERHFLQVPHITRSLSTQQVLDMRLWGSWVYETYFSSVDKVVMATIEIIRNRLHPSSGFVWNRHPGGLTFVPSFSPSLSDYPFYRHGNALHSANYTIVMSVSSAALKESSPVIKLIRSLSTAPHLSKIIIIWTGTGPPKIRPPPLPVTVTIISRPSVQINPLSRFHSVPGIETDAVLHLSEDVGLTVDEAEFGMEV
ncbi:Exostosin-1b [Geodia barretti]|nr:Exostosin-1b [Geodia barretti]CAI8005617.1 Exostosin-1b [Geodia barretti]